MSTERRPVPTRQNLLLLSRRLERVRRGAGLLRRKREALVAELFRLAGPATSARISIADRARSAYPLLLEALAREGADGLRCLGWPGRDQWVELRGGQVWGIAIAEILGRPPLRRTPQARAIPPASAAGSATEAAGAFEEMTELLLDAANREALLRRLGDALARTSRQFNTLEHRLGPSLRGHVLAIRRTLDEREREEHLRLERLLQSRRTGGRASPHATRSA